MILNCKSCGKKFVVPDNAITASGRLVQCGSCGNKWQQFPINTTQTTRSESTSQKISLETQKSQKKIQRFRKTKKSSTRKPREISLYSPEYLAKKHGIKLKDEEIKKTLSNKKVSFGFYNSLILFLLIIIVLSRGIYFFQEFIVNQFPFTECF